MYLILTGYMFYPLLFTQRFVALIRCLQLNLNEMVHSNRCHLGLLSLSNRFVMNVRKHTF